MRDFLAGLGKFIITIIVILLLIVYAVPVAEEHYVKFIESKDIVGKAWMTAMDDSLRLNEITIPGTHDSATTYVQLPFFSNCQQLTISEQLAAGFRYLDIRLGVETKKDGTSKLKLMHGFTSCKKGLAPWKGNLYLEDVLKECYKFLENNPGETIIFTVKQEYGEDSVADFQNLLNTYIEKDEDKWLLTDARFLPTLKEARGKLVLLRRYGDEAALGKDAGMFFDWKDQGGTEVKEIPYEENLGEDLARNINIPIHYVQDRYEYGKTAKWKAFYYGFSNPANAESGDAFINFLSTKGTLKYGHPFYFAFSLNKKLLECEPGDGNYGWIIVDFGTKELASKIYGMN